MGEEPKISSTLLNMKFMKKKEKPVVKEEDKTFTYYAQLYFNKNNS